MKRFFSARFAPYLLALLALFTLACTVVRTLALALAFDADIGYFKAGAPLVILLYVLTGLSLAVCLLFFLYIKKEELRQSTTPTLFAMVGDGMCLLLCLSAVCYLLLRGNTLPAPALVSILALISLLFGAGYFITHFVRISPAVRVLLGYALLLALILVIVLTYFDRYTQMNAPHKISQHLSILAALLALLCELRVQLGRAKHARSLPFLGLAGFACLTTGVSNALAFALGSYDDLTYFVFDLLLLALGLHFAAGCASYHVCEEEEQ